MMNRKLKDLTLFFILISVTILSSCKGQPNQHSTQNINVEKTVAIQHSSKKPSISKKQAISIVRKDNKRYDKPGIRVLSVSVTYYDEYGEYLVRWDREDNYENGSDTVDAQSGKITESRVSMR